jgi:hypothetical protein
MNISFAKPFRKLLNEKGNDVVSSATLLSVIKISDKSQLSESFLDYDTDMDYFIEEDIPIILLIFLKPSESPAKHVFCTVRSWSEEKELFYLNNIGNDFNIIIENR